MANEPDVFYRAVTITVAYLLISLVLYALLRRSRWGQAILKGEALNAGYVRGCVMLLYSGTFLVGPVYVVLAGQSRGRGWAYLVEFYGQFSPTATLGLWAGTAYGLVCFLWSVSRFLSALARSLEGERPGRGEN